MKPDHLSVSTAVEKLRTSTGTTVAALPCGSLPTSLDNYMCPERDVIGIVCLVIVSFWIDSSGGVALHPTVCNRVCTEDVALACTSSSCVGLLSKPPRLSSTSHVVEDSAWSGGGFVHISLGSCLDYLLHKTAVTGG